MRLDVHRQPSEFHVAGLCGLAAFLSGRHGNWTLTNNAIEIDTRTLVEVAEEALRPINGVIGLPNLLPPVPPIVRARLQAGLTNTLLQHGLSRTLGPGRTVPMYKETWFPIERFRHQRIRSDLLTAGGKPRKRIKIAGTLLPGGDAALGPVSPEFVAPLYFLPLAVFALPLFEWFGRYGDFRAALVIPVCHDLLKAPALLRAIRPTHRNHVAPANAEDAALSAQLRALVRAGEVPTVRVVTFAKKPWSNAQSFVVDAVMIEPNERRVRRWSTINKCFKPRRIKRKDTGRLFLRSSTFRGLIARNLASDRWWLEGFADFYRNPQNARQIEYERSSFRSLVRAAVT